MCLEDISDAAQRQDAQHEAELAELLAVTVDELAQRYRWNEAQLLEAIRLALVELAAHDAVQLARMRAIESELAAAAGKTKQEPR
jgi:hypothetical protein